MNNLEAYFNYFDDCFERDRYPIIFNQYQTLKVEFNNTIKNICPKNAFLSLKNLLLLEAKLQILSSLIQDNIFDLSELEIIELSETDSKVFYQEIYRLDGLNSSNSLLNL